MTGAAVPPSPEAGAAEVGPRAEDAIVFILSCFSIGILLRLTLVRWVRVPYTAMLLLVGLGIGFLQLANPATEAFTNSLRIWLSMEPHLLLLIFLPVIGFSAAIGQEPHMLRKSWLQIMLLAWPGVVIQFLLIALAAKYVFPYGWTWPEAFLFGAMLSATDPVAVVAVLQEVGASAKLACVIDGESLMNDGSALVIFLLLQRIVEGEAVTVGGAVAQFCLLAVVGMLLGAAFGVATSWLLDNIFRDATLTTIVTLVSAYASYYTADRLVGASGLLAVVCNGFAMSLIGGRQLTLRVEDSMHAFWGVLEWAANTILFVWMGIVLAIVLPPSHAATAITDQPIHLEPRDAGYVVVLYLWLQVARAILLLVCWLPFNYTGYPLTWRSATVMVWGGLRGAVGMVMALFIFLDTKIHDASFKSYCIFYMGTMAFFTVLINGGSTKALLSALGFMSYTPEQLGTLQHVVEDMEAISERRLAALRPDEVLGEPEPDAVKMWSMLPTQPVLAAAQAACVRRPLREGCPAVAAARAAGLDPQLLFDYRCRVLNMVKAHYADSYDAHMLTTLQARTLQGVTDAALDEAGEGLADWRLLEPSCRLRGLPRLARAWKLHRLSTTLVQAATYGQGVSNLTLLVGFIHAHRHAQEHLRTHIHAVASAAPEGGGDVVKAHLNGGADLNPNGAPAPPGPGCELGAAGSSLSGLRGGAEALAVLRESEAEAGEALAAAERITAAHPSLPAWLRSKQAAVEILEEQRAFLQHLGDAGLVAPREMLLLGDLMDSQSRALLRSNTGIAAALHYSRMRPPLHALPLFDSLTEAEVPDVLARAEREAYGQRGAPVPPLSWRVWYLEQAIAGLDAPLDQVVVITKGSVRLRFAPVDGPHGRQEEHTAVASVGDALGVCELMLGLPRMAELTADSMVQALIVPSPTFLRLVADVPGVRTRAWQATAAQLAAQHHHILGQHRQLAPLNIFFKSCTVERMAVGQVFEVPRSALLLTGAVAPLLPLPADFLSSRRTASGALGEALGAASPPLSPLCKLGGGSPAGGSPTGGSPRGSSGSLRGSSSGSLAAHSQSVAAPPSALGRAPSVSSDGCLADPSVPRGNELPSRAETSSYQASVLASMPRMDSSRGGGGGGAEGPSPIKDALRSTLGRLSRSMRIDRLSRTASDSLPPMPFLQGALAAQRAEQAAAAAGLAAAPPPGSSRLRVSAGPRVSDGGGWPGGGAGLHTVEEHHREAGSHDGARNASASADAPRAGDIEAGGRSPFASVGGGAAAPSRPA
ncbi:NHX8 [Scenedesmus sp. PABB004]|nr:NHX8 [Scenedesmus sp. PABB004]